MRGCALRRNARAARPQVPLRVARHPRAASSDLLAPMKIFNVWFYSRDAAKEATTEPDTQDARARYGAVSRSRPLAQCKRSDARSLSNDRLMVGTSSQGRRR
jgi:hypothetical protein